MITRVSPDIVIDGIAIVAFTVVALIIAIRDVRHRLVRNGDVAGGIAILTVLFGVQQLWRPSLGIAIVTLSAAAVNWGFYRLIRLVVPRQLGAGDPGVAAFAGLFLGHWGITPALLGLVVPYAMSAVPAVFMWARYGRSSRMAFAPFIVLTVPVNLLIASILG